MALFEDHFLLVFMDNDDHEDDALDEKEVELILFTLSFYLFCYLPCSKSDLSS